MPASNGKRPVKLTVLLERRSKIDLTQNRTLVQVINKHNLERLDEFLKFLEPKIYWDISIDWEHSDIEDGGYIDDRYGHEGERGIVYTVPVKITWLMGNANTIKQEESLT